VWTRRETVVLVPYRQAAEGATIARLTFLVAALALAACSSGGSAHPEGGLPADGGPAQIGGTPSGSPFVAGDVIFTVAQASGLEFNGPSTDVLITDFSAACAKQQAGAGVAGGRALFIGLADVDGSGVAASVAAPGTYTVVSGTPSPSSHAAQLYYLHYGSNCLPSEQLQAASGTVTLTAVGATAVAGSLDVLLSSGGDHVTGSFSASSCTAFNPNATPVTTCQ
jgi:hypothetical protein